jgi:hypothetical protein
VTVRLEPPVSDAPAAPAPAVRVTSRTVTTRRLVGLLLVVVPLVWAWQRPRRMGRTW